MRSRAAILYGYGHPWTVEEFELDPPRAGEVLLQLSATGLCHSDEHIRRGNLAPPPETLRSFGLPTMSPTIGGHEGSGVVLEVGEGVTRFAPGDHVVTSFIAVCGQCRWCATGMEYLCDTGYGTLAPGMPTDGTFRHHSLDGRDLGHVSKIGPFAEHTVVSADSLVKIDQTFPLVPAALLACAIPTRYGSAARRAQVRGGDIAVVIGAGGIGTAAIQGARIQGATRIIAVDPVEFERKSALTFGATHTAATTDEAVETVRELTRGVMADVVVVSPATIGPADVAAALSLTRKGGTCVLTGLPDPAMHSIAVGLQDFVLMNKTLCGTVFGSCNPKSDIPLLATMYQSGQLLLDAMITKRYSLHSINDAYADLVAGELIRGVIDFSLS
ncbi:Zn-dependent alcohol dehydrogenase [Mycobacterium ulcerans]|uniref:alcohol dehydrogenase n=1 Tax=Mycobacterium ulcerans (strain Agy99) TaxID=362242 RepID=A0PWQ2_MYCUA|nr:Zn-dependent alcohol dehydrogenase [Mycobacterium ulcerans]ABL06771.1 zinc-type alcohol dehydrogenase AdhD [Mycobacterium ulcerans Agy99]MEB3904847.1 Zn-dependent alcohol dehydrogenase [Mycobacterium ulcerans]MEB3908882.1 Zn-dependent alcohol dehydrogenase [Mycobacterium ulcerans]MEB3919224.1 Zn-dependent alcohol dehydrogenase [Mycobacterium ulcerans]MEB3923347.1 Zn-dependent alcohol dehydrogenase [Mycobacterium ulcerans]